MPRKPLPKPENNDIGADPDRLLAAVAYMANATPGVTQEKLAAVVARETGFVLSSQDASEALAIYDGVPRQDDLEWLAEDQDPYAARQTVSAALRIGLHEDGVTREGRRTLSSIASAVGMTPEEVAALLPADAASEGYAMFPAIDNVTHWVGRVLRTAPR